MKTIDNNKLSMGHNISIREFMFDMVLSEYEEKYGKLSDDEKHEYRKKYHDYQNEYIEHKTKEALNGKNEKDVEGMLTFYETRSKESLTERQIDLYYTNKLEVTPEQLIPILNATFQEKPNGEKIEPFYTTANNVYTQEAVKKWNEQMGRWTIEKNLLQGVSYTHLYTQFMFHQFVEDHNRNVLEANQSRDVITTTTARKMSERLEKILLQSGAEVAKNTLPKEVATISQIDSIKGFLGMPEEYKLSSNDYIRYKQHIATPTNRKTMMKVIDEVFEEETGKKFFGNDEAEANKQYDSVRYRFMRMIGGDKNEYKDYIPLSPYDPLFAHKEAFVRSGCELLFIKKEDLDNAVQDHDIRTYRYHRDKHVRATYDKWRRQENKVARATEVPFENFENFVTKGKYTLETENDRSHLSALLPYISKDELDGETLASLNKYINTVDDQYKMSRKGIEKSTAILKHLQENGVNYTITKGYEAGELDARITGTPYSIKVVVRDGKEKFLGNLYNSKTTMSTRLGIDVNNNKSAQMNFEYSIEDTLKMIDYTLGIRDIGEVTETGKKIGAVGTYNAGNGEQYNEAYYTGQKYGYKFSINTRMENGLKKRVVVNMDHAEFYEKPMDFTVPSTTKPENRQEAERKCHELAESYLRGAITSATINFNDTVGLEQLIDEYQEHKEDASYAPEFAHDATIEAIQKFYWEALVEEKENENGEKMTIAEKIDWTRRHFNEFTRTHIGTFEPDPRDDQLRFDAETVATYMTSDVGTVGNRENMVRAMKRLNIPAKELRGNEYQNQVFENRMLKFHPSANSESMLESENPFVKDIGQTIKDALLTTGCVVDDKDILIDDNGMVKITAKRRYNRAIKGNFPNEKPFTAEFGQIFIPDEDGMIKTKYAGTENYAAIPGNELYVVGKNADGPLEDRIRVRTYKDLMKRQAETLIREALYSGEEYYQNSIGFSSVYSKLKAEHLPLNYKKEMIKAGMDEDVLKAIMDTARLQCTWENAGEIRDNATLIQDFKHSQIKEAADGTISALQLNEIVNDNFRNTYDIMGRNNINQLGTWCNGLFDLSMTSGAKNQGINIYLNPDAVVNADGTITPAEDINKKVPVLEYMRYSDYDAWDRVQMTSSNFMRALRVAQKTKTAQMEFGGWTFDDGYVVSKEFAEKYTVKDKNGNMRPLQIGDKISDNHGNKGVISLVIDRNKDLSPIARDYVKENLEIDFESFTYDKAFKKMRGKCVLDGKTYTVTTEDFKKMNYEQIKEQIFDTVLKKENSYRASLKVATDWFKENPEIEVVGAPYSSVSRFNAGSAKELSENTMEMVDPYNPNRKIKYAIGEADYIITPMTVDKKTHTYGTEELEEGGGRSASAQLGWALNSQGADKVMAELFGSNNTSFANMREYLITFGMDIDNVGNFKNKYTPQAGEERNIAQLDATDFLKIIEHKASKNPVTKQNQPDKNLEYRILPNRRREAKAEFAKQLDTAGFMEIPFPIEMANGELTPQLSNGNYRLPVLPKHLRNEQSFQDGRSEEHEYTKSYMQIYNNILNYKLAEKNLEFFGSKNDGSDYTKEIKKYKAELQKSKDKSQASYDRVVDSIAEHKFSTKNNFVKEKIMGNKVEKSATAVWTANPNLDIDQVAVSPDIADDLDLVDNGYVLLWRDPLLRDEGIRYMRVVIDDNLKSCISVNPAMDLSFDGDFDGDTTGLAKLHSIEAIQQAKELLSVDANLLNHGTGGEGKNKELMAQEALDIKSVEHGHPEIKERFSAATEEINRIEETYKNSPQTLAKERNRMVQELSELYRDTFMLAFVDEKHNPGGCYNVWDKEQTEHIKRLEHMVGTGAKGSLGKLAEYGQYLGVAFEVENEKIVDGSIRVYDKPFGMYDDTTPDKNGVPFNERYKENGKIMTAEEAARTKKLNTQIATAVKSTGTGIAGAYSQRGMRALRNLCPRAVLELTYPATQGILQAKHDEKEARIKFSALMGVTRNVWNANKVEKYVSQDGVEHWKLITDNKNEPVKVTYGEFIAQFKDVYRSKDGLNTPDVNFDYVKEIAKYMVDPEDVAKQREQYGDKFDITKCKMRGIEDEKFLEQYQSPMDKLAYSYGKGRDTIKILADFADPEKNNGRTRNLFEGPNNSQFMPSDVKRNVRTVEQLREHDTEQMLQTKDAIKEEISKAREQGLNLTRKEIAQNVIESGGSNYSQSYVERAVTAINNEEKSQKTITAKETQMEKMESNQQRAVEKRQENLGLNDTEVDMSKLMESVAVTTQEPRNVGTASKNLDTNLQEMVQDLEGVDYGDLDFTNQAVPEEYQDVLDQMAH